MLSKFCVSSMLVGGAMAGGGHGKHGGGGGAVAGGYVAGGYGIGGYGIGRQAYGVGGYGVGLQSASNGYGSYNSYNTGAYNTGGFGSLPLQAASSGGTAAPLIQTQAFVQPQLLAVPTAPALLAHPAPPMHGIGKGIGKMHGKFVQQPATFVQAQPLIQQQVVQQPIVQQQVVSAPVTEHFVDYEGQMYQNEKNNVQRQQKVTVTHHPVYHSTLVNNVLETDVVHKDVYHHIGQEEPRFFESQGRTIDGGDQHIDHGKAGHSSYGYIVGEYAPNAMPLNVNAAAATTLPATTMPYASSTEAYTTGATTMPYAASGEAYTTGATTMPYAASSEAYTTGASVASAGAAGYPITDMPLGQGI